MPMIEEQVAPQLIEALMPKIEQQIAPQLVDALMPKIQDEIAPQLVDALMPKIRKEVVPTIMNDIVDDPAVRDLIREQSQGLFLDALEGFRTTLANADTVVDRACGPTGTASAGPEQPEPGLDARPRRGVRGGLQAAAGRRSTISPQTRGVARPADRPPAPPGRSFTYGGVVTRLLALAIDIGGVGYVTSQVLSTTTINLLESLFGDTPTGS